MKYWNLLPFKKRLRNLLRQQKGQSLVEFVLLLAVIAGISFTFAIFMNKSLSRYWQYSVNLIIDDRPGTNTVEL
jgi:Flp pilus assembly pilin Flp